MSNGYRGFRRSLEARQCSALLRRGVIVSGSDEEIVPPLRPGAFLEGGVHGGAR